MKTVEEIYQELLADFEKRIGMEVSATCDLAVRLYAVAAQVQALYAQTEWVGRQSFPQTAEGMYLDYHAQMRGLVRSAAVRAVGTLRFSVRAAAEENLPVPEGTVCISTLGVHFETTQAAVLTAGETFVDVPARAVEAGAAGNAGADTILSMSVPPAGIVQCTNPAAFAGGEDEETDESLRGRILDSYQRLPNGANAAFYESQALLHPGVAAARAVGRPRGIGTVDVYVAATSGVPEEKMLQAIEADLAAKREIAVDVQVKAPQTETVNVSVALTAAPGSEAEAVKGAAEGAVRRYFTGARLGEGVRLSELYALLHEVQGVDNYRVLTPAEDLAPRATVLPVLGTLSVQMQN